MWKIEIGFILVVIKGSELRYIKVFFYKWGLGSKSSEIDKEMFFCVYIGVELF